MGVDLFGGTFTGGVDPAIAQGLNEVANGLGRARAAVAALGEESTKGEHALGVYRDAMGRLRGENGQFVSSTQAATQATKAAGEAAAETGKSVGGMGGEMLSAGGSALQYAANLTQVVGPPGYCAPRTPQSPSPCFPACRTAWPGPFPGPR